MTRPAVRSRSAPPFPLSDLPEHRRRLGPARPFGPAFPGASGNSRPSARLLLDPAKNRKVRLTDKECRILKYLLRANAAPVDRNTLLADVWGFSSGVTTHTLETHIYRLRQKMEADPANPQLLLTDRGAYRLDPRAPERMAA